MDTTPVELHTDTNPVSPTHTGRTSGFLTALGALAALVGSACSSSSDTNQSTEVPKPPTTTTTVDTTTPVTTIDSTTTIVVEPPTTTVDAPSIRSIDINRIDGKFAALSLLLTGRIPTVEANGTLRFDTSTPYADFDESKIPAGVIDQLIAHRDYLEYRLSIRDAFGDFWYDLPTTPSNAIVVAAGLDEITKYRAEITTSTGYQIDSWISFVRSEPATAWQVADVCLEADGVPFVAAMLTDEQGRIAGDVAYSIIGKDGAEEFTTKSPISGLSC